MCKARFCVINSKLHQCTCIVCIFLLRVKSEMHGSARECFQLASLITLINHIVSTCTTYCPLRRGKQSSKIKDIKDLQEVKILRNITSQYRRLYNIDWLLFVLCACMKHALI